MDEKVGGEAQVCRLCGQYESIYIDIFGDEGMRRLLGLKIHSKINILIDETDPLPKTICVQCLGKLEFVCDFQEECLRTQRLLRARYDLPPLPHLDSTVFPVEIKPEEPPSTPDSPSTSTNNNSTEKNLNSTADIENVDPEHIVPPHPPPPVEEPRPKRNLRPTQPRSKSPEKSPKRSPDPTPTRRWLRSRNSTDPSKTPKPRAKRTPLPTSRVTRLRSQNQQQPLSPPSKAQKPEDPQEKQTIQIPTSALNKVLTAVSGSSDVEVCVKESKGRNGDIEDISFTLELRKKQETDDDVTVLAKVFPDQGSCLVESEIVDVLRGNSNAEISKIVTSVTKSKSKDKEKDGKLKLLELEKRLSSMSDGAGDAKTISRNPEELFRMDGEEIRVDDNVESTIVDGQSGYTCKLCKKFYERRDKCIVHVKTHLGIKQFACTLCTAKFVCKSDVMKHIRCSHTNPRPMQCPKCPKRFRTKFDLTEHDNVHKGIKPYKCADCGQSYHHKVSLQMHVKSHLPPQNLACEYCGKVFPFRTRLLSHIGSVHLKNRRNFRCRFCYNLYSSLTVLNEHIKTRHATTYTCEICSKNFKVASKYKAHVLQHSNPKPFVCNICNNKYASKAFLNEHLLKHEGLRKHVCQKCGASFAQASHLAAHRHVHGEKTHACPECGRKFNRRDNMKVHRKRHFAESGRIVSGQKNKEEDEKDTDKEITQDDGLPKNVCIRCVGTLEFLCDFLQQCEETQQKFTKKEPDQSVSPTPPPRESEEEVNKENVIALNLNSPALRKPKKSVSSPQTLETNAPLGEIVPPSPEVSEKILSEIPHSQNRKQNAQKQLPKIRSIASLGESRKSASPKVGVKSVAKLGKKLHGEHLQDSNENIVDKSTEVLKIEGAKEPTVPVVLKSVEIRPSLQKFIWSAPSPKDAGSPQTEKIPENNSQIEEHSRNVKNDVAPMEVPLASRAEVREDLQKSTASLGLPESVKGAPNTKPEPSENSSSKPPKVRAPESSSKEDLKSSAASTAIDLPPQKLLQNSSETNSKPAEVKPKPNLSDASSKPDATPSRDPVLVASRPPQSPKTDDLHSERSEMPTIDPKTSHVPSTIELKSPTDSTGSDSKTADSSKTSSGTRKSKSNSTKTSNKSFNMSPATETLTPEPPKRELRRGTWKPNQFAESSSEGEEDEDEEEGEGEEEEEEEASTNKSKASAPATLSKTSSRLSSSESTSKPETPRSRQGSTESPENSSSSASSKNRRRRLSSGSSCSSTPTSSASAKRHKSGAIYGTISQLITAEEKEAIETFYTIDMSVVDELAVEKNLQYLDKKQAMCAICNTKYPRIDKCRVHVWSHLDMKPFKCTVCDFATVTVTNIRCHIRKSHLKIKPFECNFCKKRYVTAVLLEEHLNTHSGLRPFKCKICSFSSASRQVLSYHMTTHKPVKDVTCETCGKNFFSKGRMRAHMVTHNKNRDLMCRYCSHHFSCAESLQKHLENVHSKDYVCDICGKTTNSRKALHNHQNVHSEAKYKCSLCPNVYKSGHILKEHLLKHEGIRKYKCDVCGKNFAQQSHLAAHMAVHSEKRFKCPGCQRAFNRHDNMKIHTKRCEMFKANPDLQELLNQRIKKTKVVQVGEMEEGGKVDDLDPDEPDQIMPDAETGETGSDGSFRIGQVMVIPIASADNQFKVKDGITITESVIGLECF